MSGSARQGGVDATLEVKIRLTVGDEVAMGPGKAALLGEIDRTGSISAAARSMNMSYRRAWMLVEVMNRHFREPLVHSAAGGRQGGGASVTAAGHCLLAHCRAMDAAAREATRAHGEALRDLLKPAPPLQDGPASP